MNCYEVIKQALTDEAIGNYISHGIQYGNLLIGDISVNHEKVEVLANRLNRYKLSPIHFGDAVDDWLASE